jgi:hypothetical protein
VKECGLAASIFEEINRDVGERHVCVGASAPIEGLRPKSRGLSS